MSKFYITYYDKKSNSIITRSTDIVSEKNLAMVSNMLPDLYDLYEEAIRICSLGKMEDRYRTSYIKKKNGKKRRIDEPDVELKIYMRKVSKFFIKKCKILFPAAVHSYVEGRSIKDLANLNTKVEFFVKEDIKDFFPNCTLEFIINSMEKVYPFCFMDTTILETIVKTCMIEYNGKYRLPQGAPTSPLLSNIGMIPFDYEMSQMYGWNNTIYTRYADDMFIGRKRRLYKSSTLEIEKLKAELQKINPEFQLNPEKEKRINPSKSNGFWITGIHIDYKNKKITIGSKKKQRLKAMIWSFLADAKNGKYPPPKELHKIKGTVDWYKYIEPDWMEMIIRKYEEKTEMNYHELIRNILCS